MILISLSDSPGKTGTHQTRFTHEETSLKHRETAASLAYPTGCLPGSDAASGDF